MYGTGSAACKAKHENAVALPAPILGGTGEVPMGFESGFFWYLVFPAG